MVLCGEGGELGDHEREGICIPRASRRVVINRQHRLIISTDDDAHRLIYCSPRVLICARGAAGRRIDARAARRPSRPTCSRSPRPSRSRFPVASPRVASDARGPPRASRRASSATSAPATPPRGRRPATARTSRRRRRRAGARPRRSRLSRRRSSRTPRRRSGALRERGGRTTSSSRAFVPFPSLPASAIVVS